MKKAFFLVIVCVVGLLAISCATVTTPSIYSNNANVEYTILGEVTLVVQENSSGSYHYGFMDLLAEAKRLYPEADYVIDIMQDIRSTTIFGMHFSREFRYRATAVKYK